ncbi:MAG: LamG-like jellyroll fold domain-containing protein, partial [Pseudomonadota bacterium]
MATMTTGLGGPAGYGEGVFSSAVKAAGDNDDGAVQVDVTSVFGGAGISFAGSSYTEIYINSNGLIAFGAPNTQFNTSGFGDIDYPALVPFYSDLNIQAGGEIYWDIDTVNNKITVTWDSVSNYAESGQNSFQVVLTSTGGGDFDVAYIYEAIQAGSDNGTPAVAGYTDGTTPVELAGSGNPSAMEAYPTTDFGGAGPGITPGITQPDGIVDATDLGDLLTLGLGDADGDLITTGDDIIVGGTGNDTISANAGADDISGGLGADSIDAGAGDDTVLGGDGADTIVGGDGADTLLGGSGNDLIAGDAAGPIGQGPILNLNFEDASSLTASDDGPNGLDGLYQNGASAGGTGWNGSGTGVVLDGASQYVEIPDDPAFQLNQGTISIRLNPDDLAASGNDTLFSRDSSNFDGGGHIDAAVLGNGSVQVRIQDTSQSYYLQSASGLITDGTWHHVAVSFGPEGLALYVDGVEADTNSYTGGLAGNTEPWTLGATQQHSGDSVANSLNRFFEGTLDEFAIYDTQLSPADIAALNTGGVSAAAITSAAGNLIDGGDGDDTLLGGSGDDTIADHSDGSTSRDLIDGGAGNDDIRAGGFDTVLGGTGDDTIRMEYSNAGTGSPSRAEGGLGNDSLSGTNGNQALYGGDGNDTITGGNDLGTLDVDTLDGGAGNDVVTSGATATPSGASWVENGDLMTGGSGDDTLIGGTGEDTIFGDGPVQTNLLVNGSFESSTGVGANTTPTGWTVGGTPNAGGVGSDASRATDGDQFYALGGWSSGHGDWISQDLTLTAGETYTFGVDAGLHWSIGTNASEDLTLDILDENGVVIASETVTLTQSASESSPRVTFEAATADITVRVTYSGSADDTDIDVDNAILVAGGEILTDGASFNDSI